MKVRLKSMQDKVCPLFLSCLEFFFFFSMQTYVIFITAGNTLRYPAMSQGHFLFSFSYFTLVQKSYILHFIDCCCCKRVSKDFLHFTPSYQEDCYNVAIIHLEEDEMFYSAPSLSFSHPPLTSKGFHFFIPTSRPDFLIGVQKGDPFISMKLFIQLLSLHRDQREERELAWCENMLWASLSWG